MARAVTTLLALLGVGYLGIYAWGYFMGPAPNTVSEMEQELFLAITREWNPALVINDADSTMARAHSQGQAGNWTDYGGDTVSFIINGSFCVNRGGERWVYGTYANSGAPWPGWHPTGRQWGRHVAAEMFNEEDVLRYATVGIGVYVDSNFDPDTYVTVILCE